MNPEPKHAHVIARNVFLPAPAPGTYVNAASYYTRPDQNSLVSVHTFMSRSDTVDVAHLRYSSDNGRTWQRPKEWPTKFTDAAGTGRRHPRGGYLDPRTGRLIILWNEGILPTDEPLEGMSRWTIRYLVFAADGETPLRNKQIIHTGPGFNATQHLPGVTVGKNCVMLGDVACLPLSRSDGAILIPAQSSPVGPDGNYHNPGRGFTYTDALLLIGRWQPDGDLAWTASQRICGDPEKSTRGLIEPTIAWLANGRLLMVLRGSNDQRPELPGYRWAAFSNDGGETWSPAAPWTYTDGTPFHSPSSCSQLVPYADGRLFWIGNICEMNPVGNGPRYPIVLGEVDRQSGLLRRDSVAVIDDRQPGDNASLTLSNIFAREDRETGDLLLHMSRLFAKQKGDWTADALLYRISLREYL